MQATTGTSYWIETSPPAPLKSSASDQVGFLSALPSFGQHWHLFPYVTLNVPEKFPSCNEQ
ncbi:unnamed protein product [Clavelina lepadiformis]|uniref:Uncharacterized protein n=1 Tax=Clavelina lepadiformis TaxID=159417 RepID=A0ABP0GWP4_CLALP